ncbi:hypothetical protein RM844_32300, partial [Streptomyces sp. DSM 44915]
SSGDEDLKRAAAALAAALLAACATAPPAIPVSTTGALALSDDRSFPVAPGHVLRGECPFPAERTICGDTPGEVSRNDEAGEERLVADYVGRLTANGWRVIQEGPRPVLIKADGPARCARLEALIWDDGKAARMRFQRVLRVEFNPDDIVCRS